LKKTKNIKNIKKNRILKTKPKTPQTHTPCPKSNQKIPKTIKKLSKNLNAAD
jgi:hypothetical protein